MAAGFRNFQAKYIGLQMPPDKALLCVRANTLSLLFDETQTFPTLVHVSHSPQPAQCILHRNSGIRQQISRMEKNLRGLRGRLIDVGIGYAVLASAHFQMRIAQTHSPVDLQYAAE
ncbi:hypothetical protein CBL_05295 [Carabus blaptoides fortunei]